MNLAVAMSTLLMSISEFRSRPWGYSSVGRAPALQAGGHEFESRYLHENIGRAVWFLKTFMKNLFFNERF